MKEDGGPVGGIARIDCAGFPRRQPGALPPSIGTVQICAEPSTPRLNAISLLSGDRRPPDERRVCQQRSRCSGRKVEVVERVLRQREFTNATDPSAATVGP